MRRTTPRHWAPTVSLPQSSSGFAQTDARSDVYSLGRLLGYMLTGVYPDDKRYGQLLADPHVVPSQLKSVIDRACSFEPSARIQSADELRRAILGQPAQQNENIARPAIVNVAPQSARKRSSARRLSSVPSLRF